MTVEEQERTETQAAVRWTAGHDDRPTCERDWRGVLAYEAASRVALPMEIRILKALRGLEPRRVGRIMDEIMSIEWFSAHLGHLAAETLRTMHATPETMDPADLEARLAELVVKMVDPEADTVREIIDPEKVRALQRERASLERELMPDESHRVI